MKKKTIVSLAMLTLLFSLTSCGGKASVENNGTVEESTTVMEETASMEETTSIETTKDAKEESKEEVKEELPDIFQYVDMQTLWIEDMTAEQAYLYKEGENGENLYAGTTATVVAVIFQDTTNNNYVEEFGLDTWYRKEGDEYIEVGSAPSMSTKKISDNMCIIFAKFAKDEVDVNNLYVKIDSEWGNYQSRYYKVDTENRVDLQSLAGNEAVDNCGSIFYIQDIPFMVLKYEWDWDGDIEEQTGMGTMECTKTIHAYPLTSMVDYDFLISENFEIVNNNANAEDYSVDTSLVWARSKYVGTLYGTEFCMTTTINTTEDISGMEQEEAWKYLNRKWLREYEAGFFDNFYIEWKNNNRENSKLYFNAEKVFDY